MRDVAATRAIVPDPDAPGLRAYVTGEAAFAADQAAALEGIDETLLAVTLVLILVLLLAIYRSPVLALVPLVVVGVAYLVAAARRLRAGERRRLPRHRPGHGDPDRADVRRWAPTTACCCSPATARSSPTIPQAAMTDRAAPAPGRRSSPRAGSSSW